MTTGNSELIQLSLHQLLQISFIRHLVAITPHATNGMANADWMHNYATSRRLEDQVEGLITGNGWNKGQFPAYFSIRIDIGVHQTVNGMSAGLLALIWRSNLQLAE
ncbi:hypothetical protein AVEN_118226-1 [Araneus ventricosus]|uniref:Uncharacterized protein n=1 Tax=Araneus ventricosus TaxID=182803 RepID=A0A4Y2JPV8_ARAVE|nr:hypothetical protein AVEN_118226-1 [Araneus ventricosus]